MRTTPTIEQQEIQSLKRQPCCAKRDNAVMGYLTPVQKMAELKKVA